MRTNRHSDEREGGRSDRRLSDAHDSRVSDCHLEGGNHCSKRHQDETLWKRAHHFQTDSWTNIAYGEVISALLRATKTALAALCTVKEDFDRHVRGIRAPASAELLNDLWTSKMEHCHGFRTKEPASPGSKQRRTESIKGWCQRDG